MRLIGREHIERFSRKYPNARKPLAVWANLIENAQFAHFSDLKNTFRTADYVQPHTVFDIAGNHFRLIAIVVYSKGLMAIKEIMTHEQYLRRTRRGSL